MLDLQRIRAEGRAIMGLTVLVLGLAAPWAVPAARSQVALDQVQAYIERTSELLVWAADLVAETESEQAREVLRNARDMHLRSTDLLVRERPLEAGTVARRARDAVWHAVRLARESMGLAERIRLRAERYRDLHQQLQDRARDADDRRALDFLQRSERHALRSREQFLQGHMQLAWRLLDQADELMRRAARFLANGAGPGRLADELERTRGLVEDAHERVGADSDPRREEFLGQAEDALRRAEDAHRRGEPGLALQMTALARRLALRALGTEAGDGDSAAVERLIDRFDEIAQTVIDDAGASGSAVARQSLRTARHQREQAGRSLVDGDRETALRQIRAAHDLLRQVAETLR